MVVEIAAGAYSSKMLVQGACTQAKPCYLRGTPANPPTLSGVVIIRNAAYLILEHLKFEGGTCSAISVTGAADHIVIRESVFQNMKHPGGAGCAAIGLVPARGQVIRDVVFFRNRFVNLGMNRETWATLDQDFHGMGPSLWNRDATTEAKNIWILENYCEGLSGNCVQVNAGNWPESYKYLHHIYIGRNTHCCSRQAGFWSKQARDVIISENVAYGGRPYGAQPGDGIGYQYGPDNLWIIFNRLYDNAFGIRQSDTHSSNWDHKVYIVGNVISNSFQSDPASLHWGSPDGWGISLWQGNSHRYIVDNTIVNVHNGIEAIMDGPVVMSGNLISHLKPPCAGCSPARHLAVSHPGRNGNAAIDRSLLHAPAGGPPWQIRWWPGGDFTSLAAFQASMRQCAACLDGDPLLVNPAGADFHLSAMSPARGAGTRSSVYQTFQELYGLSIAVDAENVARPRGEKWALGALEYRGGSSPISPEHRTPPVVAITSILVRDNRVTVSATARGNAGVKRVYLYIDGKYWATLTAEPYVFTKDIDQLAAGNHTVEVRAADAAGNLTVSPPATFTK
jgi:hypothetical protein